MDSWSEAKIGNWLADKNKVPFRMTTENSHLVCYFIPVTEKAGIELPKYLLHVSELQNYYKEVTGKDLEIEL